MVPSFDTMSLLPKTIFLNGNLHVFTNMVENCGQRSCIICNAAFRFNELNTLLASTNMNASVCSSPKISFMECMKTSCHLQWTSCFLDIFLHYPSDKSADHFSNTYWLDTWVFTDRDKSACN